MDEKVRSKGVNQGFKGEWLRGGDGSKTAVGQGSLQLEEAGHSRLSSTPSQGAVGVGGRVPTGGGSPVGVPSWPHRAPVLQSPGPRGWWQRPRAGV